MEGNPLTLGMSSMGLGAGAGMGAGTGPGSLLLNPAQASPNMSALLASLQTPANGAQPGMPGALPITPNAAPFPTTTIDGVEYVTMPVAEMRRQQSLTQQGQPQATPPGAQTGTAGQGMIGTPETTLAAQAQQHQQHQQQQMMFNHMQQQAMQAQHQATQAMHMGALAGQMYTSPVYPMFYNAQHYPGDLGSPRGPGGDFGQGQYDQFGNFMQQPGMQQQQQQQYDQYGNPIDPHAQGGKKGKKGGDGKGGKNKGNSMYGSHGQYYMSQATNFQTVNRHVAKVGGDMGYGIAADVDESLNFEDEYIRWHQESMLMGHTENQDRFFLKGAQYHELLSTLTESAIHYGGVHRYSIRFNQQPMSEGLSPADGVGFVFTNFLPCPKNIQKINAIFLNRKGIVCIRRKERVTRCKEFTTRPIQPGDYIFMQLDLNPENSTVAFWLEPPESGGVTKGPPPGSRCAFSSCFPLEHGRCVVDKGVLTCVIKNKGVSAEIARYQRVRDHVAQ